MRRKLCCGDTCIVTDDELFPMVDDTNNGFLKDEPDMIIVAFSKALRRFAPSFHATKR